MILEHKLDEIDRKILGLLLENGSLSFAEIGRRVGLSLPAASERVRRLEEAGIISGYQANINFNRLGYGIIVFVQLTIPATSYEKMKQTLSAIPELVEAHHVAGDLSFLLKFRLASLEDLEPILIKLNRQGQSSSIIVLSTTHEENGRFLIFH